jgi:secretin/TonB-like protein
VLLLGVYICLIEQSGAAHPNEMVRFDIAAQPIIQALDRYSAVTGREVFYDGALATGRRSNSVRGMFAPDVALRELLAGTGLTAKATGDNSFTLKSAAPARVASTAFQSYFADVQTKVSHALCARAETRPADHDRLVRIWVAASGAVEQAQLVDLSDAQVTAPSMGEAALRGLPVGAPPAGMPQPVVMAILAGTPSACSEFVTGVR